MRSSLERRSLLLGAAACVPVAAAAQSIPSQLGPQVVDQAQRIALDDRPARGLRRDVLIRWGDRVAYDAAPFAPDRPSAETVAGQFGWDACVVALVAPPPAADGVRRLVLAATHPIVELALALPNGAPDPAVARAMRGASLVNLEFQGGRWVVVDGGYQARRLLPGTLCRFGGPAASTTNGAGLLPGPGGCLTQWGTLLLGEGPSDNPGLGWLVEVNPLDPSSIPVKHTAAGRFARAGVATALSATGRLVVYMTEDRTDGYLFRFVSTAAVNRDQPGANAALLDEGNLSVAAVRGGRIDWVAVPGAAASLTDARASAEAAGATPFDAPAGIAIHPDQRVFIACRGNAQRGEARTNLFNPRAVNAWGHVVELLPGNADHGSDAAEGAVLILGGNPAQPEVAARYGTGSTAWLAAPSALAVDRRGRLWIGTEQGALAARTGIADGIFLCGTADGAPRGVTQLVYAAPRGAAIGGILFDPDETAAIAGVRHPGREVGSTFARPATRWPAFDPALPPRSTVIALAREGGGPVGI